MLLRTRADCDAPCFDQLKGTHLRVSPKQQAMLDVLLQLIKTWPLTIGPWIKAQKNVLISKKIPSFRTFEYSSRSKNYIFM